MVYCLQVMHTDLSQMTIKSFLVIVPYSLFICLQLHMADILPLFLLLVLSPNTAVKILRKCTLSFTTSKLFISF